MSLEIYFIQLGVLAGAAIVVFLFWVGVRRLLPQLPDSKAVPAHQFLSWCTRFTVGFALLGFSAPMLIPFGFVFVFLGVAPFLNEHFVRQLVFVFLFVLGICLLYVLQSLRLGDGLPSSAVKPSIWYAGGLIAAWGVCALLAHRQWHIGIQSPEGGQDAAPNGGRAEPDEKPNAAERPPSVN